jgi:hypothetical protein
MKFRHFVAMALAAVGLLALPAASSADEGKQNFRLVNHTGYTISRVYVSPHKAADWQEDVLGDDTLSDGQGVRIRFSRDSSACVWDLKVVYESDGSSAEWGNFNLCTISEISIYYDEDTEKTTATWK